MNLLEDPYMCESNENSEEEMEESVSETGMTERDKKENEENETLCKEDPETENKGKQRKSIKDFRSKVCKAFGVVYIENETYQFNSGELIYVYPKV